MNDVVEAYQHNYNKENRGFHLHKIIYQKYILIELKIHLLKIKAIYFRKVKFYI